MPLRIFFRGLKRRGINSMQSIENMKLSKLVKNGANGVIFLPNNQFKNNQYKRIWNSINKINVFYSLLIILTKICKFFLIIKFM